MRRDANSTNFTAASNAYGARAPPLGAVLECVAPRVPAGARAVLQVSRSGVDFGPSGASDRAMPAVRVAAAIARFARNRAGGAATARTRRGATSASSC